MRMVKRKRRLTDIVREREINASEEGERETSQRRNVSTQ